MSKYYGIESDFKYVKKDLTRIVIGFNLQKVDNVHYTWNEIYFNKKQNPNPSIEQIKDAVFADIDESVRKNIIETFEWNGHKIWLSLENQNNYKNALDVAIQNNSENLPVTFRFGNVDSPEYVQFDNIELLKDFWFACSQHIKDCLNAGWQIKDSIDWNKYLY